MRGSAERIYTTTYYIPSSPIEVRAYYPGYYSKESWPKDNLEYSKFNFTTGSTWVQIEPEKKRFSRTATSLQTRVLTDTSLTDTSSYRHEFHYLVAIKETRLLVFNKVLSNTHTTRSQSQTLSQRVSPSLTSYQGEIHVYLLRLIIKECEREIRLRASLNTFIRDQKQLSTRTSWTSATW